MLTSGVLAARGLDPGGTVGPGADLDDGGVEVSRSTTAPAFCSLCQFEPARSLMEQTVDPQGVLTQGRRPGAADPARCAAGARVSPVLHRTAGVAARGCCYPVCARLGGARP